MFYKTLSFNAYYPITANLWLYLLVIAVLGAMAIYTWQYRKIPGAVAVAMSQLCKALWLLGLVSVGLSAGLQAKLCWVSLEQMMSILLSYLWYLIIIRLSKLDRKIPKTVTYLLGAFVVFMWLAILTNNWLALSAKKVWLNGPALIVAKGPVNSLLLYSSYLLNIANIGLMIYWAVKSIGLRRKQAIWFLLLSGLSWVGNIMTYIPRFKFLAPQALSFLVTGILITWIYYRGNIFSILPLAQNTVIRNMVEGLVVIDEEDYIVEMNQAAQTIFQGLPAQVGAKFQPVTAAWPGLAQINGSLKTQTAEAARDYPGGRCYFQFTVTTLQAVWGPSLGKVIVFKDITGQKQEQLQRLEEQKALSVLAERNRLGRELHDGQGQIWSFLKMELETIRTLLGEAQIAAAGEQVQQLIGITRDLNTDIRESIAGLKNIPADNDLVTALREYLELYQKNYHIATRLTLPEGTNDGLFSPSAEVQLLRIIQEALTNIRKHAKAGRAEVAIQRSAATVTLTVADDGCGFDASILNQSKKSYGLQVMQERALEAGGKFRVESGQGRGTKVIVQFDLGKGTTHEDLAGG